MPSGRIKYYSFALGVFPGALGSRTDILNSDGAAEFRGLALHDGNRPLKTSARTRGCSGHVTAERCPLPQTGQLEKATSRRSFDHLVRDDDVAHFRPLAKSFTRISTRVCAAAPGRQQPVEA